MKRVLFPFLAILFACGEPAEQVTEQSKEIYIPLSKPEYLPIQDVFSEYYYVPLETTDEVLLPDNSHISGLSITNDGEIFLSDLEKFYMFTSDGKVKNRISKQGQGAGEYRFINSSMVWSDKDITVSQYGYDLISYTEKGKFISKLHFPDWFIKDITYLNDSLILIHRDQSHFNGQMPLFNVVNRYTGEIVNSHTFIDAPNKENYMMNNRTFCKYDDKVLFYEYQSVDIHEVNQDTAIVRYTINVDNRMPPKDFWKQEGKEVREIRTEWESEGYIGHIPYFVESDSLLFLRFEGYEEEHQAFAIYNKQTKESRIIKRLVFDELFTWEPGRIFAQKNGWCVIPIYAHDAITNPKFAAKFPNLQEDDNPILFIGKVK